MPRRGGHTTALKRTRGKNSPRRGHQRWQLGRMKCESVERLERPLKTKK